MAVTTPKARRLGAALREARTERGWGVRKLATELGKDHSVISRYESGERTPKPEDVATILAVLGVNGDKRDEVLALAHGTDAPQWLAVTLPEQRQQLAALLALEHTADTIVDVTPLLVPGMLQHPLYVRAIMSAGGVPDDEVETRIAVRLGRRETLTGSVHLTAVLGEPVLRQMIGGRDVLLAQLRHLQKESRRPNVNVRIVPFSSTYHAALDGAYAIIRSADETAVHLEVRGTGLFLHEPEDVAVYQRAAEEVLEVAMSPTDSERLIADVINEMETTP